MYGLMEHFDGNLPLLVTLIMTAHLAGLFCCGYFVRSPGAVAKTMLVYASLCALGSVP